jgi:hypothetical protein
VVLAKWIAVLMFSTGVPVLKGADLGLAWERNTEPDVAGYWVYYGMSSGEYTAQMWAGNRTSVTVSNLQEGVTYYFAVTATTDAGVESGFSQELVLQAYFEEVKLSMQLVETADQKTTQINIPTRSGRIYVVESSEDLISWLPVSWVFGTGDPATISVVQNSPKGFFRVKVTTIIP